MRAAPSISCYSGQWSSFSALAAIAVAVYCFGIPGFFAYQIYVSCTELLCWLLTTRICSTRTSRICTTRPASSANTASRREAPNATDNICCRLPDDSVSRDAPLLGAAEHHAQVPDRADHRVCARAIAGVRAAQPGARLPLHLPRAASVPSARCRSCRSCRSLLLTRAPLLRHSSRRTSSSGAIA